MPFLGCGICAWVGKISYSLYLIHQNVGFWIECQLMHENDLYKMQYAFIAIVIVFLLAILLFYMVEKPSRKMIADSKRRKNSVICQIGYDLYSQAISAYITMFSYERKQGHL